MKVRITFFVLVALAILMVSSCMADETTDWAEYYDNSPEFKQKVAEQYKQMFGKYPSGYKMDSQNTKRASKATRKPKIRTRLAGDGTGQFSSPEYRDKVKTALKKMTKKTRKNFSHLAKRVRNVKHILRKYDKEIEAAVAKYPNVSELEAAVVISIESQGNPNAQNKKSGASGLMQLMPGTAKCMGVNDIFDPAENIMGGVGYLSEQKQKYGKARGLIAYWAGPKKAYRYNPRRCKYTREYNKIEQAFYEDRALAYNE